jgi:hypothetical protein
MYMTYIHTQLPYEAHWQKHQTLAASIPGPLAGAQRVFSQSSQALYPQKLPSLHLRAKAPDLDA